MAAEVPDRGGDCANGEVEQGHRPGPERRGPDAATRPPGLHQPAQRPAHDERKGEGHAMELEAVAEHQGHEPPRKKEHESGHPGDPGAVR